ncbi:nitrate reductase molybdenum cofactor assembly chaperone [Leucobacter tardus]|uniref:Nitrate reductase molybdenum cofactor assembly chaperone n=1 Tax=Leucobacter tardus TaxID=501483 RepID=A0A939TND3_9MICO|nr:nitrate reductase molybdenum cofactor assembly chaperone [Leucobacter tardus]MBO2990089.1 nitrate reductase molybdenum cofactor assembly chaperone [Leucobacter tardus]
MAVTTLRNRVTRQRSLPAALEPLELTDGQRTRTHMIASLLLDYPDELWFTRIDTLEHASDSLPDPIGTAFVGFIDRARSAGPLAWQREYVTTFDLKRKCSLYLSYFATGDTRKRGSALVTFIEAYRAAGWAPTEDELPDYLPMLLEFSAKSGDDVSAAMLTAHLEGIEVLRAALEDMGSPWASIVRAVVRSLPVVDRATRERVLDLVTEGPPTETVGLSFLGNLPPFSPKGTA